jgi:NAD(P)-dependent dehydrogenase (short-subunit alcohol dehydrogenase family)
MTQEIVTFPSPTKVYHNTTYPAIDPSLPALSTSGKNIVITGGGSGIGPEIAKAFARSGASNIALLGRTESTLKATKAEIEDEYPKSQVATYVADITDKQALEKAFAAEAQRVGPIHILVANAGYLSSTVNVVEAQDEDWFRGFEINVKGNFNLVRTYLPHAPSDGTILNISTGIVHLSGIPKVSAYHGSKLAAAKLFEYVRDENPGIFVLNIHPGVIDTAMAKKNEASKDTLPFDDSKLFLNH